MIAVTALVLVISTCFLVPKAAAQSDKYSESGGEAGVVARYERTCD